MGDLIQGPWGKAKKAPHKHNQLRPPSSRISEYQAQRDEYLARVPCAHAATKRAGEHIICELCNWYVEDLLLP